MLQKIKIALLALSTMFFVATPMVAAQTSSVQNGVCQGANNVTSSPFPDNGTLSPSGGQCTTTGTGTQGINNIIRTIINVLSIIVGVIAVIMIIVGGLQYITSGGSSEKVGKAKNTILYAIIGLVIVALAQIIVRFVLNKTTSVT